MRLEPSARITLASLAFTLFAPCAFGADELKLTATCDEQGNLILHGEGSFPAGESVEIRLVHVAGSAREGKGAKQAVSASKMFDTVLEPGDLPPGDYVVEVRIGRMSGAVAVKLTSLRGIEAARDEEEKLLIVWYKRMRGASKELDQAMRVADDDDRVARVLAWEKGARGPAKELEGRAMPEDQGPKQALVDLYAELIVLAQVARGASDEEIGDLLHKTMVLNQDGVRKEASEVFDAGGTVFATSLADTLTSTVGKSLSEIDTAFRNVRTPRKEAEGFTRYAESWGGRMAKMCDRHRGFAEGGGPYPTAIGEHVAKLRAALTAIAQAYAEALEPKLQAAAIEKVGSLHGEIDAEARAIQEMARK